MSKTTASSFISGALSYLLFITVISWKGVDYIFRIGTIPLLLFFPQLHNQNIGLTGLPLFFLGGFFGIILFPLGILEIAKLCKIRLSFIEFAAGFLSASILANIASLFF